MCLAKVSLDYRYESWGISGDPVLSFEDAVMQNWTRVKDKKDA